jgi:lysophospholipase L1-like esterase
LSETERIAIFGDSIAAGESDPANGGWAGRLRADLKANAPGKRVFNFGVSGDDSAGLLERFEPQCLASNPSMLLIAIGINDTRHAGDSSRVDSLRYSLNLEKLIAQALAVTRDVTFIGLTRVDETRTVPISRSPLTIFENELIIAHDTVLQSVCHNRSVEYIPMFDLLSDHDLADGLHPNASGHQKMYDRIRNHL